MMHINNGKYDWSAAKQKQAVAWCKMMAKNALMAGCDVCVCNTFTKKAFIDAYRSLAQEFGAAFEVITMTGNFGNVHSVPNVVLENMKNGWEPYPGEIIIKPETI